MNDLRIDLSGLYASDYAMPTSALNLQNCDLRRAVLDNASLVGANLQESILFEARMQNVTLREVNLRNASLLFADLRATSLTNANLEGAELDFANMDYVDITNTNIKVATICGVDLSSVKDLKQKQIDSVIGDANTRVPSGIIRPDQWCWKEDNDED